MFSAYDIKKILPRAAFALIAATLSYSLMELVINAVNLLGDSAYSLILGSFPGAESIRLGSASSLSFAALAGTATAAAGAGLVPIVGVAAAAIFGVLFAFAIVLIRRVILTMMVIVAPIAIVAGIFPGTESLFKKWWDWFFKLLLMYPFIMAMFAVTRVSASIISQTTPDGATGVFYDLAAIALLIAPYFLIGKALSFAGGTIAKVAGFVNNKDKGLIDGLKKRDDARVATNRADAKGSSRYKDRFGTRTLNRGLGLAFNRGSSARAQDSFSKRVATLKDTSPDIESLSGDEARLLAESQGSEAKLRDATENFAQELLSGGKATDITQARVIAKAAAASAKRKSGGLSAAASAYGLQKAVESGSISNGQVIERISAGIGATSLGASQGAAFGTTFGGAAISGATKKQTETLNAQIQAINAAEEAKNFELADKLREEAGLEFEVGPNGDRVLKIRREGGTAATLKELGMSGKDPANKQDLSARTPATWSEAGRGRTRLDDPGPAILSGAPSPSTNPTPVTPATPPPPPITVGMKVRSKKSGTTGTVTGLAKDGTPLVTYNSQSSPTAYTKPENLDII